MMMQQLQNEYPGIRVRDPSVVDRILSGLVAGGADKLQLVMDFDNTLTRYHLDGKRVDNTWSIITKTNLLSAGYADITADMGKFVSLVLDPVMSPQEKTPHMIDWYAHHVQLLRQHGFNRNMMAPMVGESNVDFRDGTDRMLRLLSAVGVPLLVLSAGLGDFIREIFRSKNIVLSDNMKIFANFFSFDDAGALIGFQDPDKVIHPVNKNESAMHNKPYFELLKTRTNVVLMEDMIDDLSMLDGVEKEEGAAAVELRIGFVNSKDEKKAEAFLDAGYDIVLLDDQTMDVPNWILGKILTKGQ